MIKIFDETIVPVGEIKKVEQIDIIHRWEEMSSLSLKLHETVKYVDRIQDEFYLMIRDNPELVCIVGDKNYEGNRWDFTGKDLRSILFDRVTIPTAGLAVDRMTGNAESVMKWLVDKHFVNPIDPARKWEGLRIAPNLNRGSSLTHETRYKYVAEELTDISKITGLGFYVYLDTITKELVFDVREGRNLVYNTVGNPYVVFSEEFRNIQSQKYAKTASNFKNVAIVGGQGEGVDRTIVIVGTETGKRRKEVFIDARDVEDAALLPDRGEQKLLEYRVLETFESQITQNGKFKYPIDYRLGDLVTTQSRKIGVTLDSRIVEVKEFWKPNEYRVEPVFNMKQPSVYQVIKRQLKSLKSSVKS